MLLVVLFALGLDFGSATVSDPYLNDLLSGFTFRYSWQGKSKHNRHIVSLPYRYIFM